MADDIVAIFYLLYIFSELQSEFVRSILSLCKQQQSRCCLIKTMQGKELLYLQLPPDGLNKPFSILEKSKSAAGVNW